MKMRIINAHLAPFLSQHRRKSRSWTGSIIKTTKTRRKIGKNLFRQPRQKHPVVGIMNVVIMLKITTSLLLPT